MRTKAVLAAKIQGFLHFAGQSADLLEKLPRASAKGPSVWIDPHGYQAAINDAEKDFNADLARQQAQFVAVHKP